MPEENTVRIDEDEFAEAERQAAESADAYTHVFQKPFTYDGKTYHELRFDFASLTGRDALDIEAEMASFGKFVVAEEFNSEYLIRYAAKSCNEKIGSDAFELMPAKEFKQIKSAVRSFLMAAG